MWGACTHACVATTSLHAACVRCQGEAVRALKAAGGADKSVIDEQVALLLQLKRELAQARGEPAAPPSGSGKKKNKKKK